MSHSDQLVDEDAPTGLFVRPVGQVFDQAQSASEAGAVGRERRRPLPQGQSIVGLPAGRGGPHAVRPNRRASPIRSPRGPDLRVRR
jgi:hypothetical protein